MFLKTGITKNKILSYAALLVAAMGALNYFVLHWTLIVDPMPLTMREAAPIVISGTYAEQLKDGLTLPYAVEQYPASTSVYGPVYTILAGSLQAVFEVNPYFLQRGFVAFTMIASAILCGLLVSRQSDLCGGFLAAVWFYAIQVTYSMAAAGPSALAVLFYLLGIASILYFGPGWRGLVLAILAGFLGLLTKPYAALVIPAALIYVYLFHSPRRALIAACGTVVVSCLLAILISVSMPTYFHSVFQIHSAYATRYLDHLLSQTYLFTKLNFSLLAAFLVIFPFTKLKVTGPTIKRLWGTQPIIQPDIGFDRLMVLVAVAALFLSLGWHAGTYMTYFNHLLLPALLIAAFRCKGIRETPYFIVRLTLICNLALLIVWRPPLRAESNNHLEVMSLLVGQSALVDPVFQPYASLLKNVEVIDHGQTEYLVNYDLNHKGRFSDLSAAWEKHLVSEIQSGEHSFILLAPHYNRRALIFGGASSGLLHRLYERTHVVRIPIYFLHFKDPSLFGQGHAEVFIFQKRDEEVNVPGLE